MTLPKDARTNALLRRLMRGVDAIRAPAPPFTPPSSLCFVGSIGELRQIGRKFENCLSRMDHYAMKLWFDLAHGSVVFLVRDESSFSSHCVRSTEMCGILRKSMAKGSVTDNHGRKGS